MSTPLDRLRYHVTGAIARGEKRPVVEQRRATFIPYMEPVDCRYGSPMGRNSTDPAVLQGKLHLRRVPLVDGGCYDPGGAYWGSPNDLWCAWHENEVVVPCPACKWAGLTGTCYKCEGTGKLTDIGQITYLRAPSRADAKCKLLEYNPSLTFYR